MGKWQHEQLTFDSFKYIPERPAGGHYGIVYQGSKATIAEEILQQLPAGRRFVDLFGGGAAMSHAALVSGRYDSVLYNELNGAICQMVKKAIQGEYKKAPPAFVSFEDFENYKDTDGYIRYMWSFGSGGKNYLYSHAIEPWKEAAHNAVVFGDNSAFKKFGIDLQLTADTQEERRIQLMNSATAEHLNSYRLWYLIERLKLSKEKAHRVNNAADSEYMAERQRLHDYMVERRNRAGIKSVDVDNLLGTAGMAGHYFGLSQWEFPTAEAYTKIQAQWPAFDMPFSGAADYYLAMKAMKAVESVEALRRLDHLTRIEKLKRLHSLQGCDIEITNKSYTDYIYRTGDVVYCDPPYENTTGYGSDFDSKRFYDWAASRDYPVYFSSYDISDQRFTCIWQRLKTVTLQGGTGTVKTEKLYTNISVK